MRGLLLLALCPILAYAQPVIETKPTKIFAEAGSFYATDNRIPFWMQANQFGIVPKVAPYATLRAGVHMDSWHNTPIAHTNKKRLTGWGYGAEVVANINGKEIGWLIPEAYLKGRLGAFELMAGRRREVSGLADSTLGVGPYSISSNALPVPKVQLSLPEYTAIPFTKGLLAVQGSYAHGWFGNSGNFIQNYFLHQKTLYARFGMPRWPVKFYAGFNHQVQWGGRTNVLPETLVRNGKLPSSLKDYGDIVTGSSLGYRSVVDTTRISSFDREHRIGNHLGTIDVGLELTLAKQYSLFLYRQSIYEDGSLYYLINIQDGLHGLRLRNLRPVSTAFRIQDIVVEYLSTMSQGGEVFGILADNRGRDNYFNHSQYQSGWAYQDRTLGTPFIPPGSDTRPNLPRYNFTNNNRVQVAHIGVSGSFGQGNTFALRSSYSLNAGAYDMPFPDNIWQFSTALKLGVPISTRNGWLATATIATDQGKLYENSTAVYLGVRKTWEYFKYRIRN